MHRPQYTVPTHLLVEGAYHLDLGLWRLRLPKGPLGLLLAVVGLSLYLVVFLLHLPWLLWLVIAGLLVLGASLALGKEIDGLRLDRWLVVWGRYHWSRPRRAVWAPPPAAPPPALPGVWVRYRPARPVIPDRLAGTLSADSLGSTSTDGISSASAGGPAPIDAVIRPLSRRPDALRARPARRAAAGERRR